MVYLEWDDSSTEYGWQTDDHVILKPWKIKTIGYLVKENRTHIAITSSIGETGNKVDVLTIPKAALLKRKNIRLK